MQARSDYRPLILPGLFAFVAATNVVSILALALG